MTGAVSRPSGRCHRSADSVSASSGRQRRSDVNTVRHPRENDWVRGIRRGTMTRRSEWSRSVTPLMTFVIGEVTH